MPLFLVMFGLCSSSAACKEKISGKIPHLYEYIAVITGNVNTSLKALPVLSQLVKMSRTAKMFLV